MIVYDIVRVNTTQHVYEVVQTGIMNRPDADEWRESWTRSEECKQNAYHVVGRRTKQRRYHK